MTRTEVQEGIAKSIEEVRAAARQSDMMMNSVIAHINNRMARFERAFARVLRFLDADQSNTAASAAAFANRHETFRQQLAANVMQPWNDPMHRGHNMTDNVEFR